ncbi:hypothetical protein D3C72_1591790 [compost metagenome]
MNGVGEESGTGGHGLQDAALVLLAKLLVDPAGLGQKADQGLGAVGVEVVHNEDPLSLGVKGHGPGDVRGKVFVISADGDTRRQDLAGGDLQIGRQTANTVPNVLDLSALDEARLHGQGELLALQSLHAGLFVGANDADTLLGEGWCLKVEVADRLNLFSERLRVLWLFDEPVPDLVRFERGLILKNATRNRERCSLRCRAA